MSEKKGDVQSLSCQAGSPLELDGTWEKPAGGGVPIAQYDVVDVSDVARLMAAIVSPQVHHF